MKKTLLIIMAAICCILSATAASPELAKKINDANTTCPTKLGNDVNILSIAPAEEESILFVVELDVPAQQWAMFSQSEATMHDIATQRLSAFADPTLRQLLALAKAENQSLILYWQGPAGTKPFTTKLKPTDIP